MPDVSANLKELFSLDRKFVKGSSESRIYGLERPECFLRKPVEITNLNALLSHTNGP
jgi:hypothetical protein